MSSEKIGSAYLEVVPKVSPNFGAEVKQQTSGIGESAGSELGEKFGSGFSGKMKTLIGIGAVAVGNILADMTQKALSAVGSAISDIFGGFAEYEQLSGGVEKIFDQANISQILADAQSAYKDLNMSANEYLESINRVGASFAQTMGDQRGYDTAREGMKAIADYASGTGRSIDELNEKFSLITRSTSSYQSIADQFSGILPATSADFLKQAQAAGYLSDQYTALTQVPIDEYQQAVSRMLKKGVADMGLLGNTTAESAETITGSLNQMRAAWKNLLVGMADDNADIDTLFENFSESVEDALTNILPRLGIVIGKIATGLVDAIGKAFNSLPDVIAPAFEKMFGEKGLEMVGSLRSAIERLSGPLGGIAEHIGGIVAHLGGIIGGLAPALGDILSGVLTLGEQVLGAIEGILATVQAIIDFVNGNTEVLDRYVEGLNDVAYEARDTTLVIDDMVYAANQFDGERTATISVNDQASYKLSSIMGKIASIATTHIATIAASYSGHAMGGFVQMHADGGFVTSGPTLLGYDSNGVAHIAGEAGPEMILSKQGRMMDDFAQAISDKINGGGDTFVFNITADSETTLQSLVAEAQRARIAYGRA